MKMSALHLAAQEGIFLSKYFPYQTLTWWWITWAGNADCVQHLLEAGASVRSENGRGQSALHLAALAQSPETLELLLTKGEFPPPDDVQGVQEEKLIIISLSVQKRRQKILGTSGFQLSWTFCAQMKAENLRFSELLFSKDAFKQWL